MIAQELNLRSLDLERDAEKLAAMWNASDDQWPGTWTEGVPMTAQSVRDWQSKLNPIDVLIWDTGDEIAGYCSLWKWPKEENVTYIALLNVAPGFQKLSLGRKFLTTYVDRVVKLGSVRLDLHTWSGNLKAMPLYKKCGFFWLPNTSVHMFNYMPAILQLPLAQPYFARHDWYKTFQRDLAQVEDDETWEGMKVFTYRFQEGDDRLTVWADREARALVAVETNDVFVAALADNIEPPRGLGATLRWKLANHSDKPMQISLIASGNESLKINYRHSLELAPGASTELTATVDVAPDAPEAGEDAPVPSVRSVLVIDGQVVELATGLRPRAAIEVSSEPEFITLAPGVEQAVLLQLHSRLREAVKAQVSITAGAGLNCDTEQQTVELAPGGYAAIPVRLKAGAAGSYQLAVSSSFGDGEKELRPPATTLSVFVLAPGAVLGAVNGDKIRVENSSYRLIVKQEGGQATLYDATSGQRLAFQNGYAIPPSAPSEYRGATFSLSIEQGAGEITAVATRASGLYPGFVLSKRFTVNGGSLLKLAYEFANLSAEARKFQGHYGVYEPRGHEAVLTLPLKVGLVREPFAQFPGNPDDEFRKATAYAESWAALETRYGTIGTIWGADMEDVRITGPWEGNFTTREYECAPQSRVLTAPFYLYLGPGNWRSVRESWQRLNGIAPGAEDATVEPGNVLAARFDPPVVLAGEGGKATLRVEHLMSRKLDGTVKLALPPGWKADRTEFELHEVNWQHPLVAEINIGSNAPGAGEAIIDLNTTSRDLSLSAALVRLGDGGAVKVTAGEQAEQPVFTIANGRLEIDVAPQFGGSVIAIRDGGKNQLATPFPQVGAFGWMSPWYGGLTPLAMKPDGDNFPGKLHDESFSGAEVAATDAQGIEWRGVRQSATLQNEQLRGLRVEIDTLTVGGSNVVKQVVRLLNDSGIAWHLDAGFAAYLEPDGSRRNSTYSALGSQKHADWAQWGVVGNWAAVENPQTGRTIAVVTPQPWLRLSGWGAEGSHPVMIPSVVVPPSGSVEVVGYVVLTDSPAAAAQYAVLKDLR